MPIISPIEFHVYVALAIQRRQSLPHPSLKLHINPLRYLHPRPLRILDDDLKRNMQPLYFREMGFHEHGSERRNIYCFDLN
jgi:hypothetical protein